jgi:hypothetical protein
MFECTHGGWTSFVIVVDVRAMMKSLAALRIGAPARPEPDQDRAGASPDRQASGKTSPLRHEHALLSAPGRRLGVRRGYPVGRTTRSRTSPSIAGCPTISRRRGGRARIARPYARTAIARERVPQLAEGVGTSFLLGFADEHPRPSAPPPVGCPSPALAASSPGTVRIADACASTSRRPPGLGQQEDVGQGGSTSIRLGQRPRPARTRVEVADRPIRCSSPGWPARVDLDRRCTVSIAAPPLRAIRWRRRRPGGAGRLMTKSAPPSVSSRTARPRRSGGVPSRRRPSPGRRQAVGASADHDHPGPGSLATWVAGVHLPGPGL